MILNSLGGVGNRLRSLLSRLDTHPTVQWAPDEEVSYGRWSDAFEPIEGLNIVDHVERFDTESFNPVNTNPALWTPRYALVKPNAKVAARVLSLKNTLGDNYAAMHVRRTDQPHIISENGGEYTSDAQFREFGNVFLRKNPTGRIFLATDNGETQDKVMGWFGNVVVSEILPGDEYSPRGDHTRHSSLETSAVDLFTCVGAKYFKGSGSSSFSQTINIMRDL